jgi:hypothetical protein
MVIEPNGPTLIFGRALSMAYPRQVKDRWPGSGSFVVVETEGRQSERPANLASTK